MNKTDLLFIAGLSMIALGVFLIYKPACLVFVGLVLIKIARTVDVEAKQSEGKAD
jgi:hypothetical protein